MPNIALEQEVIAAATTIALILYLHASDVHQRRMFSRSRAATLLEDTATSKVGLLQNFRA